MILEVHKAGFAYPDSSGTVFNDISLSVDAGEVLCILGPNGVGKTSLLKCLSGLLPLTEGKICCKGGNILGLSRTQIARTIAHVPQLHNPVFAYSVYDTVLMGRTPYLGFFSPPRQGDREITEMAIDSLGIAHLAEKAYSELSGGERQLVLFARVLAQQPELIILDEPTSHLDYGNQLKILSLIRNLARSRTAIVMTSHNPDHAFMVADRVGIMFNGAIAAVGAPEDVITVEILQEMYGVAVTLLRNDGFGSMCVPVFNKYAGNPKM
jgi:iron complex transport system ATP-binding protein